MKINEFIAEYFNVEHSQKSRASRLLSVLLEYWATEKDYELKNQLLSNLVVKYTSSLNNLVELNQLKNRFLGIAAHDLRNPLTTVRGLSEILLSEATGPLTAEQKEYLSVINTASNGMLALVNDLLDISIIESGKLELELRRASIIELIRERIRIFRVLAEKKGITLHHSFALVSDPVFDVNRIAQVIDNLIGNAIKFSPDCSMVEITVEQSGESVSVSVRDEGSGISTEDQCKMFREFEKLDAKPTAGEKSTGLGLAIVKKIVEAHRGSMKVDSQIGLGSRFTFTLPVEGIDGNYSEAEGDDCRR